MVFMKRLLFFLMAIIFAIQGFSQTTVTIGSGTSTSSSGSIPGFYGFHNSALLFTASEMTQGGVIQSFGLEISTASSTSTRSMKIYLKEVSDASLASSQIMNNLLDGATLVYDSTNVNCSTTGWRNFVFGTPFNYSGTNNLLVIIVGSGCTTGGGCSVSVRYSSTPSGKAWTKVIDNSNIDFSSPISSTNTYRFNSRFIMNDLPSNYCYPPSNFSTSSLTSSGVNLSWTCNSNPDSYTIEYKPSNSDTWISGNSTLNSYSFTGLNSATTYNVRIKSNCGSLSSTSIWSYFSFLTACDQISVLPYLESFDSYGTGTGSFPICWSKVTSNTNPYISTTNSSSPGSMYMYTASGAYNYIVTPEISMSIPINTLSAFFKLYKGSADYNITVGVMSDPTNISTFDSLKNLTPTTISTWQTFDVDFANYTGLGKYIAFKVQGYGAINGMYIDDLEIIETPACAIPIGLTDLSSNTNSITLDWDAADDANVLSWIVEYKPIDSSEWLAQSAASHPFVLSGLLSGVVYQIRLYAICSDGDTTNATNTINVGMPCETISSFPWYEGFENTWFSAFGLNTGTRPWCWTNINGGEQANGVWRKTTSSSYIRTGSGALQMYSSSTSAGLSGDWFISPTISLTGNQILRFWAKGYSTYTDILSVKILNVTINGSVAQESDTSLFVDIMPNTIIPASDWVEYEVNLGQFSGDYQIAFVRNTTGGYYLNIDDISITELPICARPTNVAINSLASTEAEIKWISGHSGDASWYLYYKTNFDQFYDSILVNTNPYTLQNLIPQATYTYYLRTNCGTELSEPTNVYTFTTNCSSITQFPWYEGFEDAFVSAILPGNKTAPSCWYIIDSLNTGTYYWQTSTSSNTGSRAVYMYGYSSSTTTTATYNNNDWLISPIIHLTGSEKLNFWSKKSSSSYYPDLLIYALDISQGDLNYSIPNTNFVYLGKVDSTILSTTYSEFEFNLSSLVGDYRLAFVRKKIANGSVYIDDVKVSEIPTCFMPTSLLASNSTTTGFDLGWTDANSSLYNIQYMLSSQTDWANATTISGVTSPYSLNGLSAGTSYKVRVQTDCGTEQSEWSVPITNTTACGAITQFPWTETFDGLGSGEFPQCWFRPVIYSTYPKTSTSSSNVHSAPSSLEIHSASSTAPTYAITPELGVNINQLMVTFWAKAESATSSGTIEVGVMSDPTDLTTFESVQIIQPTNTSYNKYEVSFAGTTLNGANNYIAFRQNTISSYYYYWIDDIKVDAIPSCASPLDISATSTTNSIEVSVTPSEVTDNGWKLLFREVNSANWNSLNITSNIVTIPNLQPQMEYEIYAKTLCSDASYSLPTNSIFVATKQIPVQTPYVCNFEAQGNNGWFIKNGASVNRWMIGTPVGAPSNALFVSNNNANLAYSVGSQSVVIAEKLFNITSPDSLELSFDLMVGGESTWDFLKVFFVDMDTVFAPSIEETYFSDDIYSEGIIMQNETNNFINLIPITHLTTRFVSPGIGVQKKLIFVWRNDGSAGNAISAYIDNISLLNIITPFPPTDLEATPSITTSQLTWTPGAAELGWQVRKGETGVPVYVTTPSYQANALTPSTEYMYYIRSYYADDTLYSPWVPISFRTLAIPQRVTTLAATEIGQTTANVHGTLIAGTDTIINQGFQYRVLGGDTNWTSVSATFDDTIAYNLTGLLPYAVYEFRAFASTAYVTINGRTLSFTTLPAPPSAITSPATQIEQTVATLNGIVTQGTRPLTTKGFEWRLVGATTWTTVTSTLTDDATTYNLTGLIPITNYEYRVFATTASEIVYGSIANFTTLAIVPPTVTTIPATSIAQTIATLNANIVLGSEIITEQGFEWRLSGASTWTTLASTLNAGIITNNLTGLVASTDYEYRAYATTASGSVYGEIQNFTTLAIVPPTVITGEAIAVAQTIETINGTITAGSELVTNQGFEWRLLGESVWTPLTVSLVDNAMTYNLTALTANTNYEFRAFATTESTTTYGNIVAFRTLAMDPPVVITTAATLISQTSVTLNGSAMVVMAPITSQGFEWRLSGETTWTIIPTAIIDNNLIHNLTGLTAYTDYEFRAFATTSEGTTYGLTQSFRTLPIAPTVVTNPATSITQIIATLNGAVADGSETISAKGFEWRKVGATSWTNIILPENTLVYNLTGIVANTNYEFRAYATTESGSVYGITQTFTTLAIVPPTVVTNVATLVDQTTATINGAITAGSESILSQGFEWKLASASAWTQITSIPTSTITHNLTGLTPDRAYEFRAYATTESGTTYGTIQSFSTLVIPQAVVTNPANSITETNATLNAVVTSGSELLTSHGFEWKVSNSSTWTIVTSPLIGNALTYSLIGLTPNMDYEFRAYATTASGTIYGQIQNFTTLAIPTIVVTSSATSVAQTIATINGTITLGSKPLTSQGFEWKLASASTWTVVAKSLIGNTITHNLTGLTANTAYEFRAYAINASETIYGEVQSFTTLATVPTVVTNAATLVAQTTATLNGAITIGSESIIAQGFEWKLSSATAWIAQTSTLNGNAITHNLTGLNPNSAYQYRAYATTLSGTVYGTTQNFTTLAIVPPTVVTNAATLISQNTATLNGTVTIGSDEILVQGFEWKLATSSTWLPLTSTLTGNAITHNLIGLTPNTAYQFRAYVTTSAGTVSGTTQSFTTLAIVPPTVVTSVATAISQNIATLNGTITAGSELISSQGFEYKLTSSSTWIPIAANLNGNAITYNLLGLTPNSAYQFRAYATTFNGTVYGSTQTFTTLAIVPPTIVTSAATLIAQTSATLNGTITSGSEAIITQGFEWTLSSSNAWTITTEPLTGNAMTNILTGLNPNTSYKYRAYVITLSGTVYGQTQTFTTLSITPPTVLTSAATAITTNSATLNGTITAGTEAVISQGFEWRVFNTNIWMPITTTGSALTHNLLGLTPNESYEFRVYATTASGNVYGEIQDFTTLAIIPPTVVTNPPIVTSSREVTLSGTVISGSESILAQGFEWKEAGASQWTVVAGTLTGNTITYNLTGLTPNQSYRFRAGVVTESGITYGETQIFTTLGLNGAEGNEISIKMYPNPAKIQTKLIVSGISGDVKIILSDVQGRILSTVNTEAVSGVLEHTLDLNDLVEGVYYIRIQNSVINKTQKLIVK